MSDTSNNFWEVAQDVGRYWFYPMEEDFVEVSVKSHLAIVRRMITDASAKAGWEKLNRYQHLVADKKFFCRDVLRYIVSIRCGYAISRKEGKI